MRLGTFNLMHGRSLADGRVDPDRVREAVASLDCDVLALQEVDVGQPRSGGADLSALAAEALGVPPEGRRFAATIYGTPGVSWRPADGPRLDGEPAYGIALVSRLPVLGWRVVPLGRAPVRAPVAVPGPGGRPRLILLDDEPRAAIIADLATDAGPLTVAATHLSFVPGWNALQLRRLTRALRDHGTPAPPAGPAAPAGPNAPAGPDLHATPGMVTEPGTRAGSGTPAEPAPGPAASARFDDVKRADPGALGRRGMGPTLADSASGTPTGPGARGRPSGRRPPTVSAVILGDLNLPGPLPRAVSGWRRLAVSPTYPAPAPRVQFDHVLARGDLPPVAATQVRLASISDHRALLVDLA
jgi:endonuclease/exonuclease/phosphatase family metal-dependent hydrolase